MSAAATAAGYLYASGRLRGRGKDGEEAERNSDRTDKPQVKRKQIRIAALPEVNEYPEARKPKPAVKVEYRTRRWRPDAE
jgi:hypothetical protein